MTYLLGIKLDTDVCGNTYNFWFIKFLNFSIILIEQSNNVKLKFKSKKSEQNYFWLKYFISFAFKMIVQYSV